MTRFPLKTHAKSETQTSGKIRDPNTQNSSYRETCSQRYLLVLLACFPGIRHSQGSVTVAVCSEPLVSSPRMPEALVQTGCAVAGVAAVAAMPA
jgi:hypothetical protein